MVYPITRTATAVTLQAGRDVWATAAARIAARERADLAAVITEALEADPPSKQTIRIAFAAADAEAVQALARADVDT